MVFSSVMAHGARGDGVTDDTASIQSAINLGNVVIVPPGTYVVSNQISVPSNRVIKLLPGAVMLRKAGTGRQNSPVSDNADFWVNSDQVNGNDNITIEGGAYDGNQANQPPINWNDYSRYCGGTAMRFDRVTNLNLINLEFRNNISFVIQIGNVTQFRIEGIRFLFSGSATHQDGVHVNGPASHGVIRDIFSNGGNDALICLNADDAIYGKMTDGGDIQNILVENVNCPFQTFTPYQGSLIMLLNGTHNILDVQVKNFRGIGAQADSIIDLETYPGVQPNTGIIDRVSFSDFDVESPCLNDGFCQCDLNIGSITFKNCRWKPGTTGTDIAATYQCFFRQRNGSIANLVFDGIQIIEHNNPSNTPFVFGSVNRLVLSNILLTRPSGATQSGYLIDTGDGVTNLLVNGVQAEMVDGIVFGNVIGLQKLNGILTNPDLVI